MRLWPLTKKTAYMIHSVQFTAVIDTNVIIPIEIRDLLFWFAHDGLFTMKWSKHIFDEWLSVMKRMGVSDEEADKRMQMAFRAFPDAMVEGYEPLIDSLTLKDPNDRHVVAAAIKAKANVIVTNNLKDFPEEMLSQFGIAAISADDFLVDTIDLNPDVAIGAFRNLVLGRRNPDLDEYQVIERLKNAGLRKTADYLRALI